MDKLLNKFLFIVFSVLTAGEAFSQSPVYAQVSSKKVQVGVPFEYAIVITVNANNYTPPNLKDFDVVSGPSQSSSTQIINGAVSSQMTLSWGLSAKKEGKFTIGPVIVNAGNQRYETNPIAIEAVKGAVAQTNGANTDDPKYSNKVSGGELYIKTAVSKNKCYLGEQVTITQKVYSRFQIIGFQKYSQPTYDGFYAMAQESTSKGQQVTENVDGVNYFTYELFRTVGIANKTGKISLNTIEGDVVVRKQTNAKPRNIFEQFFGNGGYEDVPVTTKSKALTVEVMPLPEEGKPAGFNGAVGQFSYKVEVNKKEIKADNAINLKMTVSGKGNLKLLESPQLKLPEGFVAYDPKITEGGNSKSFDYPIIPRTEGDYVLKGLDFSYFNLETKKYVTIPSPEINIKVLPADPNSTGAQIYTPQNQVKEIENDIRYIKKGNFGLIKSETEFFNSFKHLTFMFSPVLLLGLALVVRRKHIKNNSNLVLVKERKAAKVAKKQLLKAEKLMQENKKDEFYTEILTAINNYLSNKLNIPVSELSRENIQKVLQEKHVNAGDILKLISTIETSEYAKYAPGAVSGDLQKVYTDTISLITDLEEQLNKKG
jgi:hypothetical protein